MDDLDLVPCVWGLEVSPLGERRGKDVEGESGKVGEMTGKERQEERRSRKEMEKGRERDWGVGRTPREGGTEGGREAGQA